METSKIYVVPVLVIHGILIGLCYIYGKPEVLHEG